MTTDESAFLRAIIAAPDDDAPRLVYADWLDGIGDDTPRECINHERAEFIRVQVAIASHYLPNNKHVRDCYIGGCGPSEPPQEHPCKACGPLWILKHRERELLAELGNWRKFAPDVPLIMSRANPPQFEGHAHVSFRRGFPDAITCTAADWLDNGDAICERHPVRDVRLTGRANWVALIRCVAAARKTEGRHNIAIVTWETMTDKERFDSIASLIWPGITFHLPPLPRRRPTIMGYPMTWEPDEFWQPTDEQIQDLHEQVRQLRIQARGGRPDIIIDIDGDRLIAALAVNEDGGMYVSRRFYELINSL